MLSSTRRNRQDCVSLLVLLTLVFHFLHPQTNLQNNCAIEEIEDEYGDLLFALINYARFLKIDPETALEKTNRKFIRRFEYIERLAKRPLTEMSLQEMDQLWEQAKQNE